MAVSAAMSAACSKRLAFDGINSGASMKKGRVSPLGETLRVWRGWLGLVDAKGILARAGAGC
jgi:hypothetical protein